ncbi:TPA: hypothetical protein PXP39_001478 [Yersinia enterocolitica]|nr:hypothetical protein [Yersinia enterocolitica]HDL7831621.1 hypothetical protein [Yersinia enterocolitica]HDL7872285.1 hypothetical protein [Yersinia enterocolitica]HDL7884538.1 hypothetical protein [Yersinia enterocolitica]HDL7893278.1 hypothetical protein [Yersinia enterocolitica]
MEFIKKNKIKIFIIFVFLVYTLFSFGIYQARTLNGNINNHILAGEMFGVPTVLKDKGLSALYTGPKGTGWDGQFYYYMSNDVLALKDTPNHIDSPSYRYQRIGLSLYAAIVAKALGMDWVSPTVYFLSYLFLLLAATWAGANLFSKLGISPLLILLWSLSVGTQVTLFNALPDAAADAFLILALSAVLSKKYILSVIPFAFSALSREVYVLFPSFILLFILIESVLFKHGNLYINLKNISSKIFKYNSYYFLLVPGVVAVCWHFYVVQHFGIAPSQQAINILGYPFVAWEKYFSSGLNGNHILVGANRAAYAEAMTLFLFLVTLILATCISLSILFKKNSLITPEVRGIALTLASFSVLYACFGSTVIAHYTGYFKAVALFFFLIPLLLSFVNFKKMVNNLIYTLLLLSVLLTTVYHLKVRILAYPVNFDKYTKMSTVTNIETIGCFNDFNAKIKVNNVSVFHEDIISRIFGMDDIIIVDVELINNSLNPFVSTKGRGSVFMSYHWVNQEGKVVADGIRTALSKPILPGASEKMSIVSRLPKHTENLSLRLSPVQEGCAWFYMRNPEVSQNISINVKERL